MIALNETILAVLHWLPAALDDDQGDYRHGLLPLVEHARMQRLPKAESI